MPGYYEAPGVIHGNRGILLVANGVVVYTKLVAQGRAVGCVPLAINAPTGTVLAVALPGYDKVPAVIHRHHRITLLPVGIRVHPELIALDRAVKSKSLAVNTVTRPILTIAFPHDHKVTGRHVDRHFRITLTVRRVTVHQDCISQRRTIGRKRPGLHTVTVPVIIRGPTHHKPAIIRHRHIRIRLLPKPVGIHPLFQTQWRTLSVITLQIDIVGPPAMGIAPLPHRHVVPRRIRIHRHISLAPTRIRIDQKFVTERTGR